MVAGDSENDEDLFLNFKNGIIVANANESFLSNFKDKGFYLSSLSYAEGVIEGLKFYMDKLNF